MNELAHFSGHPFSVFYSPWMSKNRRRDLSGEEQHVLDHGHIEVLSRPEDIARCNQAILQHHYLHDSTLVGEHMRYAFLYKGQ